MHEFIEHLKDDHKKQRTLGEQLKTATAPTERESLRAKMKDELEPHMEGEEASIFRYMRESGDDAKEHALEAIQEHHAALMILRELMDLSLDSEIFKAKASVLAEMNEHHMSEEEDTHFPWLEKNASSGELDALYKDYEAAEKAAK